MSPNQAQSARRDGLGKIGTPPSELGIHEGKVFCLKCDEWVRPVVACSRVGSGNDLACPSCGHRVARSTLPPEHWSTDG